MTNQPKFQFAVDYVISNEGTTFENDPRDKGGCTKFGITLKTAKSCPVYGINTCGQLRDMKRAAAEGIYFVLFWKFDTIQDTIVATKLFDIYVNLPPKSAIRLFQRTANTLGSELKVDGEWGHLTLDAINSYSSNAYIKVLVDNLRGYYETIVSNNPSQSVFLKGWLNRANRLPKIK